MGKINEVMTATEAAERWGIAKVTVRQACSGYKKSPPRFTAEETRQSGSTWLITVEGMQRVFGKEVTKMKKWNIEVNWHGAYDSDEWQIANDDGPIEAATAEEAEDMLSPEFLEEHMSTINEYGEMVHVDGAEYRIVEVED